MMRLPASSNCEPDCDEPAVITEAKIQSSHESDDTSSHASSTTSTPTSSSDAPETLEDCSLSYFAGYLAYQCYREYKCEECQTTLTQELTIFDKNQLLIIAKLYDTSVTANLKAPSSSFRKIADASIRTFEKCFTSIQFEKIKKKISKVDCLWLAHDNCKEHREYIIKHLIKCKIYKKCKFFNTQKTGVLQKNPKLRILSHL